MIAHRRKNLISRRRQVNHEVDDESGPDAAEVQDESLSDGSVLTDTDDDDADGEASDASELGQDPVDAIKEGANGHMERANGHGSTTAESSDLPDVGRVMPPTADTQMMMNGAPRPDAGTIVEEIQYDRLSEAVPQPRTGGPHVDEPPSQPRQATAESPHERRRREQEEYKKKRDADPTFVPNRGGFFMHDHRHAGPAANGFRPFGRGRGRGRGGIGGPFSPANQTSHTLEPADSPWTHDLHETVAQPPRGPAIVSGTNAIPPPKPTSSISKSAPPNRSFSRSTHIGNVQIRVFLAGMKDAISFAAVPVKQHTRLPHHRPPLRRDKPVRVSIPGAPPRYIFPAVERSFIFIPRAFRPNQQGYGRMGGRGSFSAHRGFSSRRTSVYGGSAYSPSVAMSRRSSLAREVSRDGIISPVGSTMSREPHEHSRPVVRLPPAAQPPLQPSNAIPAAVPPGHLLPMVNLPLIASYPPPQDPAYRENRSAALPMHQPRPQKAVSVADIESTEKGPFVQPQQREQQPFHHQVPPQVNGQTHSQDGSYHAHSRSRNASYPSQPSAGTPGSHVPEGAVTAQSFQPGPYQHQPYAYPQSYHALPQGPGYYYPTAPNLPGPQYPGSMYLPPGAHQPPYAIPVPAGPPPAGAAPPPQPIGQGSTVAQESNGMVFYYDSAQLPPAPHIAAYPPAAAVSYPAVPPGGAVGMNGMMTPSPDGFYYAHPAPGMGGHGGVYYG